MEENYKEKYLKYKYKYNTLKTQFGGFEMYKNVEIDKTKLDISKDAGIALRSVIGSKTLNALTSISCQSQHIKLEQYNITEDSLKKLSLTPEFNETILFHYYNTSQKPRLAELFLKMKLVPSKMGNFFPKELRKMMIDFCEKDNIKDIENLIINIRKKIGIYNIATLSLNKPLDLALTPILNNLETVLKTLKSLVNENVKNAIKYMFLTEKYETNDVIWEHFSALLEFILCLYNCVTTEIKESSQDRIKTLENYTILKPFTTSLKNIKDTIESYLNIDIIKNSIETYTSQLPVSFVLLDRITSSTNKCTNFLNIYENFGLKHATNQKIAQKNRLEDFLTPINGSVYIPPSVLFFLSMKLNNHALMKPDNYYLMPTDENDKNLWLNAYKEKRTADNIQPFSFYELIWIYTSDLYDLCSRREIKEAIKEVKQTIKEVKPKGFGSRMISKFFGKNKRTHEDTRSEDQISLDSVSSIESVEVNEEFLKNLEEEKHELSKLNESTVIKKSIKFILDKMKLEIGTLHDKICHKESLLMSDFDKILGALEDKQGMLGKILRSDLVRNSVISSLTLYTAFLPIDITDYNIMGYSEKEIDRKNKYIKKYKFYELYLQDSFENYCTDVNRKYCYVYPLIPPSELYDIMSKDWKENKNNLEHYPYKLKKLISF